MVQRAMHFTPKVLLSAPRRSAGVPNSSGTKVLYTTSTYSFESHKKTIELRVLDVSTGESHQLAKDDDISDLNWLDEDVFACLQAEKDGTTSLYVASVAEVIKQTKLGRSHYVAGKIDGGAGNLKVKKLDANNYAMVLSAQATPDGRLYNSEKTKKTHSTAKIYDSLFVRHWDTWEPKEKNSLWYGKLTRKSSDSKFRLSGLTNALHQTNLESPIRPFGGTDNFDLSQKGIIFVAKDPDLNPALNTKENVYLLDVKDWESKEAPALRRVVVPGFEGAASSPIFNQDGTQAAFLMMKTRGYEADKNHIFWLKNVQGGVLAVERLFTSSPEGSWDRSPGSITWSHDGSGLLITAEDIGQGKLFYVLGNTAEEYAPRVLTNHGYISDVKPLADGRIFVSGSSLIDNSIYTIVDPTRKEEAGSMAIWTHSNSADGSKFGLKASQISSIWTPASNPKVNKEVHSFVVRPKNFDASKKYPVAYIIHGGPQGAWGNNWSTRWNPAVFAEQGYIVITPNPTGSTGYGQEFTNAIRRNWGGDPYQDIVNVFEWASKNMPEADHDRAVALGASYGGYMMNWIQGHDLGRKFKCLVCHDGITSFTGLLGTEELYFPFYDLGGTPWSDPTFIPSAPNSSSEEASTNFSTTTLSAWQKWDPSLHFSSWSTPQLIIHSSKDYRLPISEGLAAFNVLQTRGVPSKFLTFPDENHWVLKPENSLVWHKVVLNWINHYAGLPKYAEEDEASAEFLGGVRQEGEEVVEMEGMGKVET